MGIDIFPDPDLATPEGLVAVGGDFEVETLINAYKKGIFPWPMGDFELCWFSPDPRGILEFSDLHVPKSLQRAKKKLALSFTFNKAFKKVITACAKTARPGQHGTWITPKMINAYIKLNAQGLAHSVEAWENNILVAGLYGVGVNGIFSGESMFYIKANASKLIILHLVEHLKKQGLTWMDIQMLTPHLEAMGAKNISRKVFLSKLAQIRSFCVPLNHPVF